MRRILQAVKQVDCPEISTHLIKRFVLFREDDRGNEARDDKTSNMAEESALYFDEEDAAKWETW